MKKRKIVYLLVSITMFLLFFRCSESCEYKVIDGFTQGTTYHIVYEYSKIDSLNALIDSVLVNIDNSMSVYNPNSIVSKINRGKDTTVDSLFIDVFNKSAEINILSDGAFDISGAPLFEAWGLVQVARK